MSQKTLSHVHIVIVIGFFCFLECLLKEKTHRLVETKIMHKIFKLTFIFINTAGRVKNKSL